MLVTRVVMVKFPEDRAVHVPEFVGRPPDVGTCVTPRLETRSANVQGLSDGLMWAACVLPALRESCRRRTESSRMASSGAAMRELGPDRVARSGLASQGLITHAEPPVEAS